MTKDDAIKIAKGAGIAALGAVLTYLTAWISGADFGSYTPMVVAAWSIVANLVRKFITPSAAAVLVAVLMLNGSASAAEPPAIKAKCSSCEKCKCAEGFCPDKCAVKAKAEAKPAGHWVQQCDGKSCRLVWVADSVAAAPVVASAPCASCQSCEAPARSGWYPGKLLGRRR